MNINAVLCDTSELLLVSSMYDKGITVSKKLSIPSESHLHIYIYICKITSPMICFEVLYEQINSIKGIMKHMYKNLNH